jgi:dTDP-4-dehydrorhamnose 3,5-epimerase
MFRVHHTLIDGVKLLSPYLHSDERGQFCKTFHREQFQRLGFDFVPREQFFSISKQKVLRGIHFQLPPHDSAKLVFCAAGSVLDVVVDLRKSRKPGAVFSRKLDALSREMIFIPKGCAHGFLALEDNSMVFYLADAIHVPSHDEGILWKSIDFDWGLDAPILSKRDAGFMPLDEFRSPFE